MFKKLKLGNQSGSGQVMFSLALIAVAGGVATYMATNDENSIRQAKVQAARDSSQTANNTNISVLSSLMRFPSDIPPALQVASNPAYVPAVYPDPYLYGGSPGTVRLASLKTPSANSRWGTNGQGEITVKGFNGGKVSDSSLDAVFQNGGNLQLTSDNQHADSKINLTGIISNSASTQIDKVRVASLASVTDGANSNYQDTIEAELTVPVPPPPEVKSFGNSPVIGWGQKASIRFQGFGLMTSFVAFPYGGDKGAGCSLTVPAAGSSIRNSLNGGFDLGSCSFGYQTPDRESGDPLRTDFGYITVFVEATGPGGKFQGKALIPAYKPASCTFTAPTNYQTMAAMETAAITMSTTGAVTNSPQMDMPTNSTPDGLLVAVTNGWQRTGNWTNTQAFGVANWRGYFSPRQNFGEATIHGRVTGPGLAPGTWRDCDNVARVNIRQAVCYEHGDGTYRYINQCYTRADGYSILWTSPGPRYNKCQGWYWSCAGCYCGETHFRDMGCFAPETQIQLADGSVRRIDELHTGDLILNPLTGRSSKLKGMVKGPEKEPMIEVGYYGKVVRVTTKHPMLTRRGIKTATELRTDDYLLGDDRKFHRLTELRRLPVDPEQQVYNFVMDEQDDSPSHHVVLADGIITGDLLMQQQLEKGPVSMSKVAIDSN